tara:strand:- start:759 stop:1538 length:780 start_codon:yes stop_codon:yes gene_type:complete
MLIKIDSREKDLFIICKNLMENYSYNVEIKTESLPLGDIILEKDEKEIIIIERKTWKDLAASIKDGRYNEQSFRLNACNLHNHNIIYLIEGDINSYNDKYTRINKRALQSSLVSIQYLKGFSLYKTNNLTETAEWILQMGDKLKREKASSFYVDQEKKIQDNYSSVCKRVKKNNVNKENIGEIILSQIPNVSVAAAIAINSKYKSLQNLIDKIQHNPNELDEIKLEVKGGKERRLSKTSINNIYEFLLGVSNTIHVDTS